MSKIFRRESLPKSRKKQRPNEKNRVRNTIINFRVSPEEKELIDARILMTGLTKAEFFIDSCLHQTISVKCNIKSFTLIQKKMEEIAAAIDRNPKLEELDPIQAEALKTILEILNSRFEKE